MGRLKGGANNTEEASKLTLSELNTLTTRAEWRYQHGGLNSAMRKDAFDRLVWLEVQREHLHGVAAPERGRPKRGG
jgi:hypothetical protein